MSAIEVLIVNDKNLDMSIEVDLLESLVTILNAVPVENV